MADVPYDGRIIDKEAALEQCCEWSFVKELLTDLLDDHKRTLAQIREAVTKKQYQEFREKCHAVKGAALNLRLCSLSYWAKELETVGKRLAKGEPEGNDASEDNLMGMVDKLQKEYTRVQDIMPDIIKLADAEGEGGGEEEGEVEWVDEGDEEGEEEEEEE